MNRHFVTLGIFLGGITVKLNHRTTTVLKCLGLLPVEPEFFIWTIITLICYLRTPFARFTKSVFRDIAKGPKSLKLLWFSELGIFKTVFEDPTYLTGCHVSVVS